MFVLGFKSEKTIKEAAIQKLKEEDIIEVTREEFEQTPEFKTFISKRTRLKTTLLKPHLSESPISIEKSKMGGLPNLRNFDTYPHCDDCQSPLNFVLQIYKSEMEDCYFPEHKDLFQIFRCPNYNCVTEDDLSKYDLKTFIYYFKDDQSKIIDLKKPHSPKQADMELEVPDCEFRPIVENDYPDHYDYEGEELEILEAKYGEEWGEYIFDFYSARTGTKCNGYPSWTQFPVWPKCTCGKIKDFFFQLSSEDREEKVKPDASRWSPHGIMIGDVGNIYFFVCKKCGEASIETNWDCS